MPITYQLKISNLNINLNFMYSKIWNSNHVLDISGLFFTGKSHVRSLLSFT